MERVLGAFDYDIHVVAVPKDDRKSIATLDAMHNDCIESVTQVLFSSLDNESLKQSSGRTSPLFKEASDEILKSIGIEPEN